MFKFRLTISPRATHELQHDIYIPRNHGHFAPVINCQRHLIFKMMAINKRTEGKRVSYDVLNNISSVDLFYDEKKKKKSSTKILGVYQTERVIAKKEDADVSIILHCTFAIL